MNTYNAIYVKINASSCNYLQYTSILPIVISGEGELMNIRFGEV